MFRVVSKVAPFVVFLKYKLLSLETFGFEQSPSSEIGEAFLKTLFMRNPNPDPRP